MEKNHLTCPLPPSSSTKCLNVNRAGSGWEQQIIQKCHVYDIVKLSFVVQKSKEKQRNMIGVDWQIRVHNKAPQKKRLHKQRAMPTEPHRRKAAVRRCLVNHCWLRCSDSGLGGRADNVRRVFSQREIPSLHGSHRSSGRDATVADDDGKEVCDQLLLRFL